VRQFNVYGDELRFVEMIHLPSLSWLARRAGVQTE